MEGLAAAERLPAPADIGRLEHTSRALTATAPPQLRDHEDVIKRMVGRVGLEPTTNALKGRCSTD